MVNALFEKGREGFLDGTLDWDTQTFSAALLDLNTADVGIKQISSSTNATPIVVTATSHGFTNGDLVFIDGHLTNTAANGFWKIANVATNTMELTNPVSGANTTGNGVGGATGYVVNYGPSASGDNWDDFDGALVGAKVNLTSPTVTAGVADAADVTFTSVSGASVEATIIFRDTGTASTSRVVCLQTGKFIVTADATLTAGTTLVVEPLAAAIPSGTTLVFSGAGSAQSATLTALANAGDRSLTVSSTTVTAGGRALAPATSSGYPVTPNGGNITLAFDNGANRIFKL
jgi:hypothetical protein